jgi:hypothetical protein
MPSQVRITNFSNFLVGSFTSTLHSKVLSLDTLGIDLFYTYCDAMWSFTASGTILYTIMAIQTASTQKHRGKPLAMRRYHVILTIVWSVCSTTLLCLGVYAAKVVYFTGFSVCVPLELLMKFTTSLIFW